MKEAIYSSKALGSIRYTLPYNQEERALQYSLRMLEHFSIVLISLLFYISSLDEKLTGTPPRMKRYTSIA
jgi:hypothetical protein